MVEVIDTPWRVTAHIPALKAAGVKAVMRYINHRNSRALPEKRLERGEAAALTAAGLRIATVFQQNARRLRDFENPDRDALRAFGHARRGIGQPAGSAVYFAVDHDFVRARELAVIRRYFEGIARARDAEPDSVRYAIGAYGSGLVLATLLEAGLIEHAWLALARGWSGTPDFDGAGQWSLRQDRISRIGALDVDENTVGASGDFGAFEVDPPRSLDGARLRVVARRGLRLRARPELGAPILRVLPDGEEVTVVSAALGWARIDADGDGAPDGHVCVAFLGPAA